MERGRPDTAGGTGPTGGGSYIFRKAINISRALCSDTQLHIGRQNTITSREAANSSIAEHYALFLPLPDSG